ncbi:MAG: biotin/lipoate A/B protein ligase family protein [Acidobacteriota bacterium]
MPWRLINDLTPRDGFMNMAIDEALFSALEEGRDERCTLRLYTWKPTCLSLGFHQNYNKACDPAFLQERGYDIVRRPTGGKAVLHHMEVTYLVTARMDKGPFERKTLIQTYEMIAGGLSAALRRLGFNVTVKERAGLTRPTGSSPCFLVPSEKEILVEGRKVIGSAQKRGRRAFLQHGAIPLSLDYSLLAKATANPHQDTDLYRSSFAGLKDLASDVTEEDLRNALRQGFQESFPGSWEASPLTEDEITLAESFRQNRYLTDEWNLEGRARLQGAGASQAAAAEAAEDLENLENLSSSENAASS